MGKPLGRQSAKGAAATMVPIIDCHTHLVPAELARFGQRGGLLPGMVIEAPDCGRLYRGAKLDRVVDERTWDARRRLRDMDERGVVRQVLSPVPLMFAYDCPLAETLALLRLTNDGIAEVVAAEPQRFSGLGGVPLQDVGAACEEARRVLDELSLAGIEVGTAAGAHDLDDPIYEPLWALVEDRGGLVFVHPDERAPSSTRLGVGHLITSTAYPSETGIVGAKLIMSGLFARHPRLRMLLAHGGGTLPWLLPRLDRVWSRTPSLREALPDAPSATARRFWYDTLTYDVANVELLARRVGIERLVIGTDYPFVIAEDPPGEVVRGASLSATELDAVLNRNAGALLGSLQLLEFG